ncbi:fructosamine kinase family protein [uncultured Aquimarina sp.]|uniref:fructosamine kinase family protein n=1 Tax=uncultured Aquimarina sp. TaxID=575652 RepID=UPI00260C5457|nr:fructosamine kinase family protein [uncultured Aquimarina sp.]
MLSKQLIKHFENLLSEEVNATKLFSGGDINEVFLLSTNVRELVVKLNSASRFPGMFEAEALGLEELRKVNAFAIPEVLHYGKYGDDTFLLLEYIEKGKQTEDFWKVFGEQLAVLHRQSASYFGLENDNYIGSLQQSNSKHYTASEFYIIQRLQPQFKIAIQNGFSFQNLDTLYTAIETEIPDEPSSLTHGDLWNGNFIIDEKGEPCLIDPAVAYAPREMDIGMMHLFGGFDRELFEVYNETFPLTENWKERLPLWQLYYLLVHLNLFGRSYYSGVKDILIRYS